MSETNGVAVEFVNWVEEIIGRQREKRVCEMTEQDMRALVEEMRERNKELREGLKVALAAWNTYAAMRAGRMTWGSVEGFEEERASYERWVRVLEEKKWWEE